MIKFLILKNIKYTQSSSIFSHFLLLSQSTFSILLPHLLSLICNHIITIISITTLANLQYIDIHGMILLINHLKKIDHSIRKNVQLNVHMNSHQHHFLNDQVNVYLN